MGIEEGQDAKLAERILSTRGFEVELKEEPNKLLAGKVLRVTHRGETVLPEARYPKGTALQLVVGVAGAKDVRVPWLVGLSLKDAKGILSRRNLALGHVGYGEDVQSALDSSLAVVVSQDVSPGMFRTLKKARQSTCTLANTELTPTMHTIVSFDALRNPMKTKKNGMRVDALHSVCGVCLGGVGLGLGAGSGAGERFAEGVHAQHRA